MRRLRKMKVKKSLKNKAEVAARKRNNDGSESELKKGSKADSSIKAHKTGVPLIGMSKGVTKNMGDFESLRVDVWLSAPCDNISQATDIVKDIETVIDDILEETLSEYE